MKHIATALIALLTATAATAATGVGAFVAIGGESQNCHYALETAVAAHTAGTGMSVHHGVLWFSSKGANSGINDVTVNTGDALTFDGITLGAAGFGDNARVTVISMDGRTIAETVVIDGTADLSALAKGIYIVRVVDANASAHIKIAR